MTRYLCAAAYLDPSFRDRVLGELLLDRYRAVAPSYGGCDLIPIVHHCRRARTMLVVRDALITALLALGLWLTPLSVISWLTTLIPFVLLTADRVRRGSAVVRVLLWIWAGYNLLWLLFTLLLSAFTASAAYSPLSGLTGYSADGLFGSFAEAIMVPLATLTVAVAYRIAVYLTLAGHLGPGSPPPAFGPTPHRTAQRLDYVARAQWGDITMYANENPFMGAGHIWRTWSIAVELDRTGKTKSRRQQAVDIDPMKLHAFVRTRLLEMRDQVLRPNESIQRLDIGHHVVTRGVYRVADWQRGQPPHPMIDLSGLPRSRAGAEEIAAIARHPQGGVRYYQRVTVANTGQEIRDATGRLVVPAEDQEALTSAFIHLAVEGRMLYTQFVVTVLPPMRDEYHVVDRLPAMAGTRIIGESLRGMKLHLLRDVLAAPVRLVRAGAQTVRQQLTQPDPAGEAVYPYGARLSVRELGASDSLATHIQRLDVAKYTKLVEQRLTEAVLDFLEKEDVDTRGYRLQAASVITNNTNNNFGNQYGPVSVGNDSSASTGG
ncbi:hypothetical protein [Nonomuraea sp. NPDC048826]|uniref:hypothetical protein n=1 Tax=Nonomuraea sp. NPDC048826 TaxID=3364347 RepID=UPI00371F7EC8